MVYQNIHYILSKQNQIFLNLKTNNVGHNTKELNQYEKKIFLFSLGTSQQTNKFKVNSIMSLSLKLLISIAIHLKTRILFTAVRKSIISIKVREINILFEGYIISYSQTDNFYLMYLLTGI